MRVIERSIYRGPHLYSELPMIRIQLDLGSLEDWPTDRLPDFEPRLKALLPGLDKHGCSYGEPGGFFRRIREGTWLGHVIEHVALELQTTCGSSVTRGKTRSVRGRPGLYNVMYAYREESVGLMAGRLAVELVRSLLPEDLRDVHGLHRIAEADDFGEGAFEVDAALSRLRRIVRRSALGPTTASLVREAERRGIAMLRLDETSLVQLGTGKHQKRIRASLTGLTSEIATEVAGDKDLTKLLLSEAGLPVPRGVLVYDAETAVREAERLGYPVVTKPLDGNHGRGVTIGVTSPEEARWGFEQAREHSRTVIVEQHFEGSDHRILVVGGEIVAVAERVPARVIGDGRSTISELIEAVNTDPRRGEGHESVLTRIHVDDCLLHFLGHSGLALDSVPEAGKPVLLRPTANLSTGGTAIDRTEEIHPENASIARRAALVVGLDVAGIDFMAADISKSVRETGGGIIEVNAAPGFRMHLEPSEGRPRNIARPVLDHLFPHGSPSRIPILAVTGTNGKSTTVRMLAHVLCTTGAKVGFTTTTGVYIDGERIVVADASGPKSAKMILRDPTVDVAVLETARGGILREGLGFDRCDIGAVLNVKEDHLGFKGIHTVEDLAAVKSVVVESVRRGGWSVLNADDPLTVAMERDAGGRIAYFSMSGAAMPDFLREHIANGGFAVVRKEVNGRCEILIHEDGEENFVMEPAEIPATIDGMADFNVENALAAIAMSYLHGVPIKAIRNGLRSFTTSFEQSPGRLNVHDAHGFRTILDYAHNPHGLSALGVLVGRLKPRYNHLIGMVSTAGDRRDQDIREMGALAARIFDTIVFREEEDLRGRQPGEIARLLHEGACSAGCEDHRIVRVLAEDAATEASLRLAQPGDLVVLIANDVEAVWNQLLAFEGSSDPIPVTPQGPSDYKRPLGEVRLMWSIIVHGGAKEIEQEKEDANRRGCRAAR
jgi:cyanophycin synthetase